MRKETMTPKERWLAVLAGRSPDRIPMDYWTTPEAKENLMRHLGCADDRALFRRLHIDSRIIVEPDYIGPRIPEDGDVYGCRYREADYGSGRYRECIHHPLAGFHTLKEIESGYTWPSADWYDYGGLPRKLAGTEGYPIQAGGSEPFLVYEKLRGDEQALVDLMENPSLVLYCLDKLYGLAYAKTRRILETIPGAVTYCPVGEDMGSQDDLIFSPGQVQEFFVPWMRRMIALVHQAGAFVFHHNDGAIRKIIPAMIDAGIDILNPIQWRCRGMDRETLKKDFGGKVVFHGGVDNQHTLAFGNVEDVRSEVRENLRILGNGGRYILAPCHNIQAVSPPENIVAMYETGYAEGWV